MSIPASRIRQIRAIFAKAKKHMARSWGDDLNVHDVRGSEFYKHGRDNYGAWVSAQPKMVRRLRDFHKDRLPAHQIIREIGIVNNKSTGGKYSTEPIYGYPPMHGLPYKDSELFRFWPSGRTKQGTGWTNRNDTKRNIKLDQYIEEWRKRRAGRKTYRILKKMKAGQ